jgi:2-polyprenyl-3-methyl-5-hydroxy-6-metoxy-1,4-benzoquinol methylase
MIYGTVPFNKKNFQSYLNKNTILLDYGCGTGIWDKNLSRKISKIYLYDCNQSLYKGLKEKYAQNKRIFILKKIDKIKKIKINTVVINSVFQYVHEKEIIKLIKIFYKTGINKILISDIPRTIRLIEIFYNIFNYYYIINSIKYFANPFYHKIKYYIHNYNFLKNISYKNKIIKNFNNTKNRYGILLWKH